MELGMARMTFMTKSKGSKILLRTSRDPREHLSSYLKRARGKPSRQKNSTFTSQIQVEQFHFYLFYRLALYIRFRKERGVSGYIKKLEEAVMCTTQRVPFTLQTM